MAQERDSDTTLLWVLFGTVVIIVLYYYFLYDTDQTGALATVTQTIDDALNAITRGSKLTNAPADPDTGLVESSPDDLAASAGMDTPTYSLARAIASEEEGGNNTTKLAIGWAIVNYSNSRGYSSVTVAVTTSGGQFGTQVNVGYCSTARDPYAGDAAIAAGILSGQMPDNTGGAIQFDDFKLGPPANVVANREKAGEVSEPDPGGRPSLEFWRKV